MGVLKTGCLNHIVAQDLCVCVRKGIIRGRISNSTKTNGKIQKDSGYQFLTITHAQCQPNEKLDDIVATTTIINNNNHITKYVIFISDEIQFASGMRSRLLS